MKRIFAILTMMLWGIVSLSAQIPQRFSYQAVIRNGMGNVVSDQNLDVRISILKGSIDGDAVYSETHTATTTVNGVVTLEIGGGKTSDDFSAIDWSNGPFFINSAAELNGRTISVTSQLLSVPYALYAQKSFLANRVEEDFLASFVDARVQSFFSDKESQWENRFDAIETSVGTGVDDRIQNAMNGLDSLWENKFSTLESSMEPDVASRIQSVLADRDSLWESRLAALESSAESDAASRIQSVLADRDSLWESRLAALESSMESDITSRIQAALADRDSLWERKLSSLESSMDSGFASRIQAALAERDSLWERELAALQADMDSLSKLNDTSKVTPTTNPKDSAMLAKHGILPGVFNGYHFSQGILQYHEVKNVWRFAKDQLERIGKSYKDYRKHPANTWVDRFEMGTSGYNGSYPATPYGDRDVFDIDHVPFSYTSDYDWGYHNAISNGGNKAGVWHGTDQLFWWGIFSMRDNAENLYSKATVDGVKGFILLPDDWESPSDFSFTPRANGCGVNIYDKEQWTKLEALGAVFFPADIYWACYEIWSTTLAVDMGETQDNTIPEFSDFSTPRAWDLCPVRLVISDVDAKKMMEDESIVDVIVEDGEPYVEDEYDYLPDNNVDLSNVDMTEGVLPGKFSVSESKQVVFSKGNLQYHMESKKWRFAETQTDFIGAYIFDYAVQFRDGWNDMFSWATSGYGFDPNAQFPHTSYFGGGLDDIAGTKYDWGVNNPISNGGNTPNIWRTLTKDEWEYLVDRKKDGVPLMAPATVNETDGFILLPDDWAFDDDYPYIGKTYQYSDNVYSGDQWSRMESLGVVFLPSAGANYYNSEYDYDMESWKVGGYWSTNAYETYRAWALNFYTSDYPMGYYEYWYGVSYNSRKPACSVRLVRDVK